ncbi:hypothetical protein JOF56_008867 [Kibdelosporangium banguiense]|uniref:Uncharacterized protein n=1 Tax=Kibdelosporangium banguiense TaxID=1365924 RepID=A0ABS4TVQ3_9PSEU|nr:hypothetical protein [Kibdelosporangium banguiense]
MCEELTTSTEHEEARALLTRVVAAGPARGTDTAPLLRTLRRRYIWQRGTVAGVVALSVVGAVSGAMVLAGLSRTPQAPVLPAASSSAGAPPSCFVESVAGAGDGQTPQPVSPSTPPPPCPRPEWTIDDRARALTAALDAAKDRFLSEGMTVTEVFQNKGKPAQKPFEFLKQTYLLDVEYTANAYIGDGKGTRAVVDQTHAQFSAEFLETWVDAVRPDGTEFHLRRLSVSSDHTS